MPSFILGVPNMEDIEDKNNISFKEIVDYIYQDYQNIRTQLVRSDKYQDEIIIILPDDIIWNRELLSKLATAYGDNVTLADYIASRIYDKLQEQDVESVNTINNVRDLRLFITTPYGTDSISNDIIPQRKGYIKPIQDIDNLLIPTRREKIVNRTNNPEITTVKDMFADVLDSIIALPKGIKKNTLVLGNKVFSSIYALSLYKSGEAIPWVNTLITFGRGWGGTYYFTPMMALAWKQQVENKSYAIAIVGKNNNTHQLSQYVGFVPMVYVEGNRYAEDEQKYKVVVDVHGLPLLEYNPFYEYIDDMFNFYDLPAGRTLIRNPETGFLLPEDEQRYYLLNYPEEGDEFYHDLSGEELVRVLTETELQKHRRWVLSKTQELLNNGRKIDTSRKRK